VRRREFLAAAAGALALAQTGARKPNILFILADDLGYADLGCYGQEKIRTPNIDRLAAEGMKFHQVYAGHAVCAPSRCCLMTGMHTGHATVRNNHSLRTGERVPLKAEDFTVAELLKQSGYVTGISGKWGLGEPDTPGVPNRQGFDEWFGFLNQDHAVDYYTDHLWRNETREVLKGNLNGQKKEYTTDLFTRDAIRFLRAHKDQPFFYYLAYTAPHADLMAPSLGQYSGQPWTENDKTYAAMVSHMDAGIGQVLGALQELALDEHTLVMFSSDNGAGYGAGIPNFRSTAHFRSRKGDLYEGGIRVPMIARWKGRIQAGRDSEQPWAFWDFLPTAAELAGAAAPRGIDGVSAAPSLFGKPMARREYLYWETNGRGPGFRQAIRMGDWKAVHVARESKVELYDLAADPSEKNDVAASKPDVTARAREIFRTARTDNPEYPVELPARKKTA
jgi:arylsulfatase A-like enzyme